MTNTEQIHASCVTRNNAGILILGESGSGKSDLALRMIDAGATLVADDRVNIRAHGNALYASAPQKLAGLLEVRGIGILHLDFLPEARLHMAITLVERGKVERLPEKQYYELFYLSLPHYFLHGFDVSTPAKIDQALHLGMEDNTGQTRS